MDQVCPDIVVHQPLPGGRTWTASCESINPRHDDAYYLIEFWEDDHHAGCMMVVLYARLSHAQLHAQLHKLAELGTPNTDYRGSWLWRRNREAQGLPMP